MNRAARGGRDPQALDRGAFAALLAHDFPGNIRELENLLEGAATLSRGGVIRVEDLQWLPNRSMDPLGVDSPGGGDVPNLRLAVVRADISSTFTGDDGTPVQQPILTTTAARAVADGLNWEALTPAEVLGRFETTFDRAPSGQGRPIGLAEIEGSLPPAPGIAEGAA